MPTIDPLYLALEHLHTWDEPAELEEPEPWEEQEDLAYFFAMALLYPRQAAQA